jgi:hypothetical protein
MLPACYASRVLRLRKPRREELIGLMRLRPVKIDRFIRKAMPGLDADM